MAVYQVQPNGSAPAGLSPGDFVNTNGGMYAITSPGALGSAYNPDSGYWSTKVDSSTAASSSSLATALSSAQQIAENNSNLSQAFAREQMAFQREQNSAAMAFSASEAQKNRDFQQSLSDTAHQREVADLIKAGLNPILSANAGASTPSGASASGVTSAGASGTVDTSLNSLIGNLVSTLISSETSKDIAALQAQVNRYVSDNNLLAAQTSAAATMGAADLTAEANKYIAQNYPTSMWGMIREFFYSMGDYTGSSHSKTRETMNAIGNIFKGIFK